LEHSPRRLDQTHEYDERYLEYFDLFNERYFYDCHEVLEDLWLDTFESSRKFYQGLIHLATAFQHLFRGNRAGSEQRFLSTLEYLRHYPHVFEGLDLEAVRASIHYWLEQLRVSSPETRVIYCDAMVPKLSVSKAVFGAP